MSEQNRAFALFVLGALLFAAAIVSPFAGTLEPNDRIMLCTAFFGLPYLLWEFARKINWWVVLYLAVLVPLYYFAAWLAGANAWGENGSNGLLVAGLAGGLVGGALSLFTLRLRGLRRDGAQTTLLVAGVGVLTVLGGLGTAMADAGDPYSPILWLYLPWQVALGFFISRLMRISPRRGAAAA